MAVALTAETLIRSDEQAILSGRAPLVEATWTVTSAQWHDPPKKFPKACPRSGLYQINVTNIQSVSEGNKPARAEALGKAQNFVKIANLNIT